MAMRNFSSIFRLKIQGVISSKFKIILAENFMNPFITPETINSEWNGEIQTY